MVGDVNLSTERLPDFSLAARRPLILTQVIKIRGGDFRWAGFPEAFALTPAWVRLQFTLNYLQNVTV